MIQWTDPINGAELVASIIVSIGLALAASYLGSRRALRKQRELDRVQNERRAQAETMRALPELIDALDNASMYYWFFEQVPLAPGERFRRVKSAPRVSDTLSQFEAYTPDFDQSIMEYFRQLVRPLDAIRDAPSPIRGQVIHQAGLVVMHALVEAKEHARPHRVDLQWFRDQAARP